MTKKRASLTKWQDFRKEVFTPAQIVKNDRRIAATVHQIQLRELRKLAGMTQVELATRLNGNQSDISKVEASADHRLSTLRRYVEALGGELQVIAKIGNKSMALSV